jgi:hypothetical protein
MDPFVQNVAITAIEVFGALGLFGIIAWWRLAAGHQKLRAKELDIEAMRLENEARALALEDRRLGLALDEKILGPFN